MVDGVWETAHVVLSLPCCVRSLYNDVERLFGPVEESFADMAASTEGGNLNVRLSESVQ